MDPDPDPDDYFDLVLFHSRPGGGRVAPGPAAQWQTWWRVAARRLARDRPDVAAAAGCGFVLGTGAVRDRALSRQQVRSLVRSGAWSAPLPGTVAVLDPRSDHGVGADEWSLARRRHALCCAAAVLRNPGCVVCGPSAAILHGLPTLDVPEAPVLTAPPALHTRRHRAADVDAADLVHWYGVPVTAVARTVADVARHDRRDGLVVADAALREGLADPAALAAAVTRMRGWPGTRAARETIALADGRSESPLESLTRLALHDSGFPAPDLQIEIAVPGRRTPYRVDLCWPELRLVLECDGRLKYHADTRWKEKQRDNALRRAGYRVERVHWSDVVRDWAGGHRGVPVVAPGPHACTARWLINCPVDQPPAGTSGDESG